ncbi:MAG: RNA polymerase sigma-70 factor (ECF subfamily), partial [Planctomycetota bacterium]
MQPAVSTDTDLVAETLAGQQLSFQLLVERHQGRLFAVVRNYTRNRVEVEDIVQDAFLKAFKRLDSFQHQASFST